MTRVWGSVPDWMLKENFDSYKAWITQPLYSDNYIEYDDSDEI